jgi:hypothetical protein
MRRNLIAITMGLMITLMPFAGLVPSVRAQAKVITHPAPLAARGSFTSAWFPVFESTTFIAYLTVTAKAGGSTSLDVKYQESPDRVAAFDLPGASFSQVTGSTSSQAVIASRLPAGWVRCVATVVGTTFTFSSSFMAVKLAGNQVINSATDGSALTGLDASALATGTVPNARFPATLPAASGANLTALNATNLGSGTVPVARISGLLNAQVDAAAAIAYSKLNLSGQILDADVNSSAAIAASKLAEDVARTASVTVATGAVLALNSTPVELVAAPAAGKVVLIEEITCKLVFNSVSYTGSNALEFRYTNGSGAKVTADMGSAFLNSASGTNYQTVKSVVTALAPVAAAAVVVFVPTANPGAGNSALVFKIKYRIVTP